MSPPPPPPHHGHPHPHPPPGHPTVHRLGKGGETVLWITFVIFLLSFLGFSFMAWRTPISKRILPLLTTLLTLLPTLTYFTLATGGGTAYRPTHPPPHHPPNPAHPPVPPHIRQTFPLHHLTALLTTPLILLTLSLLAGLSGANTLVLLVAGWVMVTHGVGWSAHNPHQRAGYLVFAALAYLTLVYLLALPGRRQAFTRSRAVGRFFTLLATYSLVLWLAYPIIITLAHAGGKGHGARIGVDGEVIAIAIVDVLSKAVFSALVLAGMMREGSIGVLMGGGWTEGWGHREGVLRVGGEGDED